MRTERATCQFQFSEHSPACGLACQSADGVNTPLSCGLRALEPAPIQPAFNSIYIGIGTLSTISTMRRGTTGMTRLDLAPFASRSGLVGGLGAGMCSAVEKPG